MKSINPLTKTLDSFPQSIMSKTANCYNKAFHAKLLTLYASSESEVSTFAQISKVHYDYCFAFMKNDEGQWFLDPEGIKRVRSYVLEKAKSNPEEIHSLFSGWEKDWRRYLDLSKTLNKTDLSKLGDSRIYSEFNEFYVQYLLVGSIAYIADSFMSTGEQDWLEEMIKEELGKKKISKEMIASEARILTSPVHLSFSLESEHNLFRIGSMIEKECKKFPTFNRLKRDYPKIYALLLEHEKRFFWVQNNYYNVHYITAEEFYGQLIKFSQEAYQNKSSLDEMFRKSEESLSNIRDQRQEIIETFGLSDFMKNILGIARLFSKWKDIRKSGVYIGMHHFDVFLEEIARRSHYTKRQLTFCFPAEIKEVLLKKKDMHAELGRREKQCFFAVTPEGYFISSGKDSEKFFHHLKRENLQNMVDFKGVTASPGYARGRVHIIRKTGEMKMFQDGEILVTNQTTPEFLPIMRKAAAIITEQGGITSHAAVVSRELKIPCIIGIKDATHFLMDKETIEVDATNGIVRRLR